MAEGEWSSQECCLRAQKQLLERGGMRYWQLHCSTYISSRNRIISASQLDKDKISCLWTLGIHFQAFNVSLYSFLSHYEKNTTVCLHFEFVDLYSCDCSEISSADLAAIFIHRLPIFFPSQNLWSVRLQVFNLACDKYNIFHSTVLDRYAPTLNCFCFLIIMAVRDIKDPCALLFTSKKMERFTILREVFLIACGNTI